MVNMTSNQIAYWSLEETKRSNKVNEKETQRANKAREGETNRHNLVTEAETNRHNLAIETLTSQANAEQARHNQATELIANFNAQEAARSNLANEALKHESNMVGFANVSLGYANLAELTRHQQQVERNDLLKFNINQDLLDRQLEETNRHNAAMEQTSLLSALTGTRSTNLAEESLTETKKKNKKDQQLKLLDTLVSGVGNVVRSGVSLVK